MNTLMNDASTVGAESSDNTATSEDVQEVTQPQQGVEVKKLQYVPTPDGLSIRLGAKTSNTALHYPEYRWVQYITTNVPLGGAQANERYEDPQPPDDSKPFYYTDQELPHFRNVDGYDLIFTDRPRRDPAARPFIYWKARLVLVGVSPAGSTNWTEIVRIDYGFDIHNGQVKLAPVRIKIME